MKNNLKSHLAVRFWSYFLLLLLASLFCCRTPQVGLADTLSIKNESGAVPSKVVSAVRQDISKRYQIPTNTLKMTDATRQTWPNGCLGLAKTDEICSQALVSGWRVTLSNNRKIWIYRTDNRGRNLRLEKVK